MYYTTTSTSTTTTTSIFLLYRPHRQAEGYHIELDLNSYCSCRYRYTGYGKLVVRRRFRQKGLMIIEGGIYIVPYAYCSLLLLLLLVLLLQIPFPRRSICTACGENMLHKVR